MAERTSIPLRNLLVDDENPRIDVDEIEIDQDNVLKQLLIQEKDTVLNLAEDIVEHGLDPSSLPIVMKEDEDLDEYLVLEGNRRIAALKVLTKPELAPAKLGEQFRAKFVKLADKYSGSHDPQIECVVVEGREDAQHWIILRHTGKNKGVGTVDWSAKQRARYEESIGRPRPGLRVLEYVADHASLDIDTSSASVYAIKRVISNPYARTRLGLEKERNVVYTKYIDGEVIKGLSRLVEDLASGRENTRTLNKRDDIVRYINSLPEGCLPDLTSPLPERRELGETLIWTHEDAEDFYSPDSGEVGSDSGEGGGQDVKPSGESEEAAQDDPDEKSGTEDRDEEEGGEEEEGESPERKERPSPEDRSTVIPKEVVLEIDQPRINIIYKELKKLNVNHYPNAASVLLRVFLELSLDHFISQRKVRSVGERSALGHKLKRCAAFMKDEGVLSHGEAQPIFRLGDEEKLFASSVRTMHEYIHNRYLKPSPLDLKTAWDNMAKFVDKIWHG
jgi:hypothetical protein